MFDWLGVRVLQGAVVGERSGSFHDVSVRFGVGCCLGHSRRRHVPILDLLEVAF